MMKIGSVLKKDFINFVVQIVESDKGYSKIKIIENSERPETVGNVVILSNWILASYKELGVKNG